MDPNIKLKHKLNLITDFKNQGKYLHAIQICEHLLAEYPTNFNIHIELAELYELSGNLGSSYSLLESYLDKNSGDKEMRMFFGQLLIKNNSFDKAIEVLSKIVPEEKPIALFLLGHAHFMIKDFDLSRISFLSFLSLEANPELVYESYIYLAKIEIEMNDFEQALSYTKRSELLFNSYWELYLLYAICYHHLGMDEHAAVSIEKSIRLNPKASVTYDWAGKIFLRSGDYIKAEKYLVKYIDSAEAISSETYSNLGEVYLNSKKTKLALDYFELALKMNPANKTALSGKRNISEKYKSSLTNDL